jgi:hypothetical protein
VPVHIEQIPPARVAVADIRNPLHASAPHRERQEQDPREWETSTQTLRQIRVDAGAPPRPERPVKGLVDCPAGLEPATPSLSASHVEAASQ